MLELLNQPWFGSVVGIVGLIFALVGLLYYRASRIGARPVYFQRARRLIGKEEQELPKEVEITFNGQSVPRLTATQCFLWNSGKSPISGSDIVPSDPLRLEFGESDQIMKARVARTTRSVNNLRVDTPPESNHVLLTFDFLDPGDGAVLELLHTSAFKFPKLAGTIKGIPRGLIDLTGNPRVVALGRVADRFPFGRKFLVGMLMFGIAMITYSLIPKDVFPESWFDPSQGTLTSPESTRRFTSIMFFVLGLLYIGLPALILIGGRRRYPQGLEPSENDLEESPNKPLEPTA